MSEQNIQLSRRFFEDVCNKRQLSVAVELFATNHTYHDPSSTWVGNGPGGMKDLIGVYHNAVNDARWEVHSMIAAGDTVVTRWSGRGTHTGDLMGIAPTSKKVSIDGIWMHRIADGKIVESWNCWDMLGLLQQLGVVPTMNAMKSATEGASPMSGHKNVKLIQNIYGLFTKGDVTGMLNQFAETIEWETPGHPRIPYAGHFRGRAEVGKFFEGLGKTAEMMEFEPRDYIAEGDRVVVLGHYAGKGRATGRKFATDWAMVFTVKDGKVTKFKEYFDTFNLGAAFS